MAMRGKGKVILRGVRYSARVSGAYYAELKKIVEYVNALFMRTIFVGLDTKQMAGKIKVQDESPNWRVPSALLEKIHTGPTVLRDVGNGFY